MSSRIAVIFNFPSTSVSCRYSPCTSVHPFFTHYTFNTKLAGNQQIKDAFIDVDVNSGATMMSFTRPLSPSTSTPLSLTQPVPAIYALGALPARGGSPSRHTQRFVVKLSLATGGASVDQTLSPWLVAHIAMMVLSFGLLLPLGALAARFLKEMTALPQYCGKPFWFVSHVVCQV